MTDLRLDWNNLLADKVGTQGLTRAEVDDALGAMGSHIARVASDRRAGKLQWMDLPYAEADITQVEQLAAQCKDRFENVVVLGIGGSALGMSAVKTALAHPFHNLRSRAKRKGVPRLFVLDNIDPDFVNACFEVADPKKTLFNVISKSGGTAETMAQFQIVMKLLGKKVGDQAKEHVVVTTDPKNGVLRRIVRDHGFRSLPVPEGVGGRFSVLSPVGLFPAALLGVDIRELLAGAARMDEKLRATDARQNMAAVIAATHHALDVKRGKRMHVMMGYGSRTKDLCDWYRQLLAESIGKKVDIAGNVVNTGVTPIDALGVTDQHSQVQLYAEGPHDKVFTFVSVESVKNKATIPDSFPGVDEAAYLAKSNLKKLLDAEELGTIVALTEAGRPNMRLVLPEMNAHAVGQFFYLWEVDTALRGSLYAINAFDQPGVEAGKIAAFALMGRKGYEEKSKEIRSRLKGKSEFVV